MKPFKIFAMPKKVKESRKTSSKSHYTRLKSKWLKQHKLLRDQVLSKHSEAFRWMGEVVPAKEKIASGAVGALMLANTLPVVSAAVPVHDEIEEPKQVQTVDWKDLVKNHLDAHLPGEVRPLTNDEESVLGQLLSADFGFDVSASLDGHRLNRSYGYIGAEQHLMRYPGDIMYSHLDQNATNNPAIYSSGMAPGRGAWGYFARSKAEMTSSDIEREKWYIAVPTFLAPGFYENVRGHYDWFKFRKMLVVNPKNGKSLVVDIGDAGPAQWTGKHLGGSPEVMNYLQLHDGRGRGAVLYFFINDAGGKIPLGPVVR